MPILVIGQNDRKRMSKKQDKEIERKTEEFKEFALTAAKLIFETAEKNNIPQTAMCHGAGCYIRSMCLAMKMPYKDFLMIIRNLTNDYEKDLDN
jgi:hypothetical protein